MFTSADYREIGQAFKVPTSWARWKRVVVRVVATANDRIAARAFSDKIAVVDPLRLYKFELAFWVSIDHCEDYSTVFAIVLRRVLRQKRTVR
ncbi:hypothetical protein [Bradyrhizobium sp. 33ap4]|uniref:hypothetical protein n=1 Tax=Bradyrhizobium sp. 33ap4 TaxID=3061630 RepID=UPI00292FA29F|nr:hypothetical protein [Bradyrhizobium sp. 33ap4]